MKFFKALIAMATMVTTANTAALNLQPYQQCTLYDFVTTGAEATVTVYKTTRVKTYSAHCFGCKLMTTFVPGTITVHNPPTVTRNSQFAWKTVCSSESSF